MEFVFRHFITSQHKPCPFKTGLEIHVRGKNLRGHSQLTSSEKKKVALLTQVPAKGFVNILCLFLQSEAHRCCSASFVLRIVSFVGPVGMSRSSSSGRQKQSRVNTHIFQRKQEDRHHRRLNQTDPRLLNKNLSPGPLGPDTSLTSVTRAIVQQTVPTPSTSRHRICAISIEL